MKQIKVTVHKIMYVFKFDLIGIKCYKNWFVLKVAAEEVGREENRSLLFFTLTL
jgi:hypothetical protein